MSRTIVAFGELLWDVFPTGEVLGGAPANFAYRINSLGDRGIIVTRLGKDERGERAVELLKRKGMSLEFVQWDSKRPTGFVPITLDAQGVPEYTIAPEVAYDHIEFNPALNGLAARADAICFGTLIQRSPESRETLHRFLDSSKALKILDLNLRKDCFSNETIEASLRRADILKLNESEAEFLGKKCGIDSDNFAAEAVKKWELECCVVTLGPEGAVAASRMESVRSPIPKVPGDVVDTVGCGDAFTAMFAQRWLAGVALKECCDAANKLGAAVARTRGGMELV